MSIVERLKRMTNLTKMLAIDLQTACIPVALTSYWLWANLTWVPIYINIPFSNTFYTKAKHCYVTN